MIHKITKGKRQFFIFQGSALEEGLLRKDFVFTKKELERAAKRERLMRKHIAKTFKQETMMELGDWQNRPLIELANVLALARELERNRLKG